MTARRTARRYLPEGSDRPSVISASRTQGVCRARNVGASLATAPWIAYCDSDDLWHRDKLDAQVRLLRAVPGLEYAFTNFRVVTDGWSSTTKFDEVPAGYWDLPRRQVSPEAFVIDAPLFERVVRYNPIFPSTIIMSQDFFLRVGRWVVALGRTLSEDLEFTLRCVTHPPIGVLSAPLVGIRKHPGNFSADHLRTLEGEIDDPPLRFAAAAVRTASSGRCPRWYRSTQRRRGRGVLSGRKPGRVSRLLEGGAGRSSFSVSSHKGPDREASGSSR